MTDGAPRILWLNQIRPDPSQLECLERMYGGVGVEQSRKLFEDLYTIPEKRRFARSIAKSMQVGKFLDVVIDTQVTLDLLLLLNSGVQPLRSVYLAEDLPVEVTHFYHAEGKSSQIVILFDHFVRIIGFGTQEVPAVGF